MIKKYAALYLLVTSLYTFAGEPNNNKRKIPEIFFIDQENTVRMLSIQEGNERLKQEVLETTKATIEKHEQEHKNQKERHEKGYEEIRKNNEQSITVKLRDFEILFNHQLDEGKQKFNQQIHLIQESLNSSTTHQRLQSKVETKEAKRTDRLIKLEKMQIYLALSSGTAAISAITTIGMLFTENKIIALPLAGICAIATAASYYFNDESSEIKDKLRLDEEKIKKLKTTLIPFQPATEESDITQIAGNTELHD